MGLFDFAREKLTAVTDALPTDLVDQALSHLPTRSLRT